MCVREKHAPRREAIDVWRLRLRVPTEAADPVVQVIDRDQQDIRRLSLNADRS
ncbi:hypothetical protein RBWH47_04740 [Rhodopirellula baltica WH47]|uniref:Uncharacterized protein n=1 Tax=Rhodopirellula baltica WH47 TaxID=991778 RepID=F2ALT3_RHOBT|nr:hypothetical protein RBWH47_04740 [Rhodopirellula baltica WH47]